MVPLQLAGECWLVCGQRPACSRRCSAPARVSAPRMLAPLCRTLPSVHLPFFSPASPPPSDAALAFHPPRNTAHCGAAVYLGTDSATHTRATPSPSSSPTTAHPSTSTQHVTPRRRSLNRRTRRSSRSPSCCFVHLRTKRTLSPRVSRVSSSLSFPPSASSSLLAAFARSGGIEGGTCSVQPLHAS